MKNKYKLKSSNGNNIYVSTDLTNSQRQEYGRAKEELSTRISQGENNLAIKYIKGIPKVVSKN